MSKIDWKTKLASRKFWALVAAFIGGVALIIAGDTSTETITGAVMAAGAVVAYILGESWVDAADRASSTTSTSVTASTSAAATVAKIAGVDSADK